EGEARTHQGEARTHQGEARTHQGEARTHQGECRLVVEVGALAAHLLLRLRQHTPDRLAPPAAARLAPGDAPLGAAGAAGCPHARRAALASLARQRPGGPNGIVAVRRSVTAPSGTAERTSRGAAYAQPWGCASPHGAAPFERACALC